ncbi:hypothetical protein [Hyphomicrobium facile]|uniref:Uncharacterized protein n=1 Tax=Hyphomicrobium facile TaxID=51670 RepID=A0A1I7NTX8_9HYPH|nr:hypothetical protein [Hyphomicrobium facile]SFV38107.1 hypothetical protein SAMN04488557_3510 [Hyphomicrobium facile]
MSYRTYAAALLAALSFAVATSAEARHRRCDFDPYGYRAPSRWCGREGWGFYPAYGFYPAGSYYALPRYPVYAVPVPVPVPVPVRVRAYPTTFCYFDNGYDFRPRRVCVPAW